jgi:hypothetical protein
MQPVSNNTTLQANLQYGSCQIEACSAGVEDVAPKDEDRFNRNWQQAAGRFGVIRKTGNGDFAAARDSFS